MNQYNVLYLTFDIKKKLFSTKSNNEENQHQLNFNAYSVRTKNYFLYELLVKSFKVKVK